MIETWRNYSDIPLDQLRGAVDESDVELFIDVGGDNYLTRDNKYSLPVLFQQLRTWHHLAFQAGPNIIGYDYSNFPRSKVVGHIETPEDVPPGGFTWFGTVDYTSEMLTIGNLIVNHHSLIERDYQTGISTPAENGHILFDRYREPFLASLEICHELIHSGLRIIELAFRGESAPVRDHHVGNLILKEDEKLATSLSIDLLCAALRLPDFRRINLP